MERSLKSALQNTRNRDFETSMLRKRNDEKRHTNISTAKCADLYKSDRGASVILNQQLKVCKRTFGTRIDNIYTNNLTYQLTSVTETHIGRDGT